MAFLVHLKGRDLSPRCPVGAAATGPILLNLQLLRKARENSATCFRHDHNVFQTRPADAGVVQAGFDCHHLAVFQNNLLQTGMFVDFETKPMARAVEKSDAPAVAHFSWKSTGSEQFLNSFVDRHAINTGFDFL